MNGIINYLKMMTLDKAIELLKLNYDKAITNPTIYNPIAWALYKTWRAADSKGKKLKQVDR